MSHDNGYVRATAKKPFVTVEDEAIAQFCIDSGYFERVTEDGDKTASTAPQKPAETVRASASPEPKAAPVEQPAASGDDEDELEAMTVNELKAYAETCGIDLGKLTKKPDIVKAIRAAEAE